MTGSGDIVGLLGAYALDALGREERRRVEEALQADPRLAEAAAPYLRVAEALAEALIDPADRAPAALWGRIEAAIRR